MIAIVDDDTSIRAATENLVRSLGFRAASFESAEEFIASEERADTTCLITDVQMRGLSGLQLQDILIAQGCTTPMIFMTGLPGEDIRERALSGGAIGFFRKPIDQASFIECLNRAIPANAKS